MVYQANFPSGKTVKEAWAKHKQYNTAKVPVQVPEEVQT